MRDAVNAINANSAITLIDRGDIRLRAIADLPPMPLKPFSDSAAISEAASDFAKALRARNADDFAQQMVNLADPAATGTVAAQYQVQADVQPSLEPVEQSPDTVTISQDAIDMANDLQKQDDRDYGQQLADTANLAATETVATQNREIISALYNMSSAYGIRRRAISQKDLQI
ncbi:MAG: hypothetical protein CSYNP_04189 [Syntrophus sp. SKADARSKE-3]|nr:hypothetical protein [Syntrophus sp. SKADARSKE-3]